MAYHIRTHSVAMSENSGDAEMCKDIIDEKRIIVEDVESLAADNEIEKKGSLVLFYEGMFYYVYALLNTYMLISTCLLVEYSTEEVTNDILCLYLC